MKFNTGPGIASGLQEPKKIPTKPLKPLGTYPQSTTKFTNMILDSLHKPGGWEFGVWSRGMLEFFLDCKSGRVNILFIVHGLWSQPVFNLHGLHWFSTVYAGRPRYIHTIRGSHYWGSLKIPLKKWHTSPIDSLWNTADFPTVNITYTSHEPWNPDWFMMCSWFHGVWNYPGI